MFIIRRARPCRRALASCLFLKSAGSGTFACNNCCSANNVFCRHRRRSAEATAASRILSADSHPTLKQAAEINTHRPRNEVVFQASLFANPLSGDYDDVLLSQQLLVDASCHVNSLL
eukprot:GHVS01060864.1.p1 GENE.GHVS01060864.1~~GHVS01060864.1.p1  ORF type:complete len:117 (-),score=11.55 GHVS01060864.1:320-670(-)